MADNIILTNAGKDHIAKQRSLAQAFVIDSVKFANVSGQSGNPSASDTAPSSIAHTHSSVSLSYLNPDTAIYSVELNSNIGNFSFNWIGWYSGAVLCFIEHVPVHQKQKTAGSTVGNTFIRNLRLLTAGSSDLSGASAPSQSWNLDYTTQFQDLSQGEESINQHLMGKVAFLADGFQVKEKASSQNDFSITGGTAYFDGFELTLAGTDYTKHRKDWLKLSDPTANILPAASGTKTEYVFLKVTFNRTAGIAHATAEVVLSSASSISDSNTSQGIAIKHYQIAKLIRSTSNQISNSQITDTRTPIQTLKSSGQLEVLGQIDDAEQTARHQDQIHHVTRQSANKFDALPFELAKMPVGSSFQVYLDSRDASDTGASLQIKDSSGNYQNFKKNKNGQDGSLHTDMLKTGYVYKFQKFATGEFALEQQLATKISDDIEISAKQRSDEIHTIAIRTSGANAATNNYTLPFAFADLQASDTFWIQLASVNQASKSNNLGLVDSAGVLKTITKASATLKVSDAEHKIIQVKYNSSSNLEFVAELITSSHLDVKLQNEKQDWLDLLWSGSTTSVSLNVKDPHLYTFYLVEYVSTSFDSTIRWFQTIKADYAQAQNMQLVGHSSNYGYFYITDQAYSYSNIYASNNSGLIFKAIYGIKGFETTYNFKYNDHYSNQSDSSWNLRSEQTSGISKYGSPLYMMIAYDGSTGHYHCGMSLPFFHYYDQTKYFLIGGYHSNYLYRYVGNNYVYNTQSSGDSSMDFSADVAMNGFRLEPLYSPSAGNYGVNGSSTSGFSGETSLKSGQKFSDYKLLLFSWHINNPPSWCYAASLVPTESFKQHSVAYKPYGSSNLIAAKYESDTSFKAQYRGDSSQHIQGIFGVV